MSDDARMQVPAREIAAGIRSGRFSAAEVVEAHIRRIEVVNPCLNALVADRFEAARAEARTADRELRASGPGGDRPLLGVPFTVKEMIAVDGMPLTFGCRSRVGIVAGRDATVVARLRAAGAIPLGVTNVPEWGMWFESYNSVYGRTRNPWDPGRTPGGSSGGEGAIVGAGGSAFGVGSDIGGSVRMPAAFCGTYGHKPGSGLLPLTGHYPIYADGDRVGPQRKSPYLAIGPLTRSARDIPLLLRVMAGPDGVDPNACAMAMGDADAVEWRDRPVVLLPAPDIARARRASPDAQRVVRRAGRILEERGAAVTEAPPALLRRAGDAWFAALQSVGGPAFTEVLGGADGVRLLPEIAATLFGRGRYSWPALFFCIGEAIGRKGEAGLRRALAEGEAIRGAFTRLTGEDGVLIAPVSPRAAPRHNEPALFAFDFLYTAVFNSLRVPATAAPMGFDGDGLPLAVQVAAARGNDHVTIAAAMALEDATGPWRPAPAMKAA